MAALAQDLITRIVNIKWPSPGAVFVTVDYRNQHYIRIQSKTAEPEVHAIVLPETSKGPAFITLVTSYKRIGDEPTFVLGGIVEHEEGGQEALAASIWISNDGRDWRHAFLAETDGPRPIFSQPNAVVWSTDSFYFDQRVATEVETPAGLAQWRHEQVYQSADGEAWSGPIIDQEIPYGAETAGYRSPFPPAYCTHNDSKDTLEQNVPDGHMKDDVKKGVLMRPKTPITINYGTPSYVYGASNIVEVVTAERTDGEVVIPERTDDRTVPDIGNVNCVAGANGVWLAGGELGAAVSFDEGATWTPILATEGEPIVRVVGISVAPLEDFSADARL